MSKETHPLEHYSVSVIDPLQEDYGNPAGHPEGTYMWARCLDCKGDVGIPLVGPYARAEHEARAEAERDLRSDHSA